MRLIDADAAIKDARANYGGVHDAVLMEHFLNTQPTITPSPNNPLTIEDLREMDGEPVWVVFTPDIAGERLSIWTLVYVDENDEIFLQNGSGERLAYEDVATTIDAIYRRKPEKGEDNGKQS